MSNPSSTPVSYKGNEPQLLQQLMNGSAYVHISIEISVYYVACTEDCVVCPRVFDGICAHIASAAGFDALYLAGSGASDSVIGELDLSVITANELADTARMIVNIDDKPVVADADTDFGGPLNVARTTAFYEAAGVRVGSKTSLEFDIGIADKTKKDVNAKKYEDLKSHDLF